AIPRPFATRARVAPRRTSGATSPAAHPPATPRLPQDRRIAAHPRLDRWREVAQPECPCWHQRRDWYREQIGAQGSRANAAVLQPPPARATSDHPDRERRERPL